ncbi:MAG: NUDIX domain-containing protein [Woeseiaceae bacterium]
MRAGSENSVRDEPRPSSTVMLIRDGAAAPEILMLKRHINSAFGDVYVFPGGVVDPCDTNVHDCCDSLCADDANSMLGTSDALCFFSAAIRELFEETGVLLARPGPGNADGENVARADMEQARHQLIHGELTWDRFVRERKLVLGSRALHYFAHWVTPQSEPKRFSTRFFVATIPAGQVASHDGCELTDSCWKTANEVLAAQESGQMRLIYPTWRTLGDIANFGTADDIVAWADDRQRSGVARVLPAIIDVDGEDKVVLPGDPRYPDSLLA